MRFSLYSEIQLHPGKTPEQIYAEVLEQIDNADRLGYDVYSVIEHFFFPKFSISANPTALFAAAAQRTQGHPLSHDAARAAVPQSAGAGLRDRGDRHPHRRALRVGRRPRPRLDPGEGRRAAGRDTHAHGTRRPSTSCSRRSAASGSPTTASTSRSATRTSCRSRSGSSASTSAAPPTARTRWPPSTAGVSPCRRSSRTSRSRSSSTCTGRPALSSARSPTSSGSTRATSTRIATRRCARAATGSRASSRATAPR